MSKAKLSYLDKISKLIAIGLTIVVLAFIFFLVVRQVVLNNKLAKLQYQEQLQTLIVSPSPRPNPNYTTPKGTESWSVYQHPQQNFTVRYPNNMKVGKPTENAVGFYAEGMSKLPTTFWVGKVGDTLTNSHPLGSMSNIQEFIDDLFNTKTNFVKRYQGTKTNYVQITKNASLRISGYPAVFYTEAHITLSGQEQSSYKNIYLVKVGDSYYMIGEGYGQSLETLHSHEELLGLVARSFTLF